MQKLKLEQGCTVVMVLDDLNQATRFADYIVTLKDGKIVKAGKREEVIIKDVLRELFNINTEVGKCILR